MVHKRSPFHKGFAEAPKVPGLKCGTGLSVPILLVAARFICPPQGSSHFCQESVNRLFLQDFGSTAQNVPRPLDRSQRCTADFKKKKYYLSLGHFKFKPFSTSLHPTFRRNTTCGPVSIGNVGQLGVIGNSLSFASVSGSRPRGVVHSLSLRMVGCRVAAWHKLQVHTEGREAPWPHKRLETCYLFLCSQNFGTHKAYTWT